MALARDLNVSREQIAEWVESARTSHRNVESYVRAKLEEQLGGETVEVNNVSHSAVDYILSTLDQY